LGRPAIVAGAPETGLLEGCLYFFVALQHFLLAISVVDPKIDPMLHCTIGQKFPGSGQH